MVKYIVSKGKQLIKSNYSILIRLQQVRFLVRHWKIQHKVSEIELIGGSNIYTILTKKHCFIEEITVFHRKTVLPRSNIQHIISYHICFDVCDQLEACHKILSFFLSQIQVRTPVLAKWRMYNSSENGPLNSIGECVETA